VPAKSAILRLTFYRIAWLDIAQKNTGSLSREESLPLKILAGKMASLHHHNAVPFNRHQLMLYHQEAGLLKWWLYAMDD
jgi:hypothetical protein